MRPLPPRDRPFPYTTLFRSNVGRQSRRTQAGQQTGDAFGITENAKDSIGASGRNRGKEIGQIEPENNSLAAMFLSVGNDGSDRKSTRLNSSHLGISYAVFCL